MIYNNLLEMVGRTPMLAVQEGNSRLRHKFVRF